MVHDKLHTMGGWNHDLIFTVESFCLCKIQMAAMSSLLLRKFLHFESSGSFESSTTYIGKASPVPHSTLVIASETTSSYLSCNRFKAEVFTI